MRKYAWLMVVALLVLVPLLAACGGPIAPEPTTPPAEEPTTPTGGPPAIPHTLEGRDDCLMCHGETGIKPFPADHAGRTNDTCTACHQPAD